MCLPGEVVAEKKTRQYFNLFMYRYFCEQIKLENGVFHNNLKQTKQ